MELVWKITTEDDPNLPTPEVTVTFVTLDIMGDVGDQTQMIPVMNTCVWDIVPFGVGEEEAVQFDGLPTTTCEVGVILTGCPDGNQGCHTDDKVLCQFRINGELRFEVPIGFAQ